MTDALTVIIQIGSATMFIGLFVYVVCQFCLAVRWVFEFTLSPRVRRAIRLERDKARLLRDPSVW